MKLSKQEKAIVYQYRKTEVIRQVKQSIDSFTNALSNISPQYSTAPIDQVKEVIESIAEQAENFASDIRAIGDELAAASDNDDGDAKYMHIERTP